MSAVDHPLLETLGEPVSAFDPDGDPRAVRFRAEDGVTWLLTPPMDGGSRFLRQIHPDCNGPVYEVIELFREEGDEPESWPLVVGVDFYCRTSRVEHRSTAVHIFGRLTSIEVLGRPIAFRRPSDG